MEVGDSSFPEFEGTEKRGIGKLGSAGKMKPKCRPYYLANTSRQQKVLGSSNITPLAARAKKPKTVKKD